MRPSVGFVYAIFGNVGGYGREPQPSAFNNLGKMDQCFQGGKQTNSKIDPEEMELVNRHSELESSHEEVFCGPR